MEIVIEVLNDDLDQDGSRTSDLLFRDIQKRLGKDSVWKRHANGWRISS